MGKVIADQGELVGLCGWNGTSWEPILIDGTNRLVIAVGASALPTGAATSIKQLPDGHAVTVDNVSLAVTGAFYQVTQPISAAALPLPTLAATAAKQLADGHNVTVDNATLGVLSGGDKIFGFESVVEQQVRDEALSTGFNTISGTPVASGKVWRITSIALTYVGTIPTVIRAFAGGLAGNMVMIAQSLPASAIWYRWTGEIYMQVGDYVFANVYGATENDTLDLRYCGVQMNAP